MDAVSRYRAGPQVGHCFHFGADARVIFWDASIGSDGMPAPANALSPGLLAFPEPVEMSCEGREFANLGRKLLLPAGRALAQQMVHPQESVFGAPGPFGDLRDRLGRGLARGCTYRSLIQKAFDPKYWSASGQFSITQDSSLVRGGPNSYARMEFNFPLFWGLSVMLYGSTLVSDESPFDRHQLTEAAARGEAVFNTRVDADGNLAPGAGNCSGCHSGDLFSQAAVLKGASFGTETVVDDRPDGTGAVTPAHFRISVEDYRWYKLEIQTFRIRSTISGV